MLLRAFGADLELIDEHRFAAASSTSATTFDNDGGNRTLPRNAKNAGSRAATPGSADCPLVALGATWIVSAERSASSGSSELLSRLIRVVDGVVDDSVDGFSPCRSRANAP